MSILCKVVYVPSEMMEISLLCLFCRLPEGPILAKDLAIEYKYLSNTSEWFMQSRTVADQVIQQGRSMKIGKQNFHFNNHNGGGGKKKKSSFWLGLMLFTSFMESNKTCLWNNSII